MHALWSLIIPSPTYLTFICHSNNMVRIFKNIFTYFLTFQTKKNQNIFEVITRISETYNFDHRFQWLSSQINPIRWYQSCSIIYLVHWKCNPLSERQSARQGRVVGDEGRGGGVGVDGGGGRAVGRQPLQLAVAHQRVSRQLKHRFCTWQIVNK